MDVTVSATLCFLLLISPQISLQQACSPPTTVDFPENSAVGAVVATITTEPNVKMELTQNPHNSFTLEGNDLKAAVVFDYEAVKFLDVRIVCTSPGGQESPHSIVVVIEDVNEHAPVFEKSLYDATVNELSPVGTEVGTFHATDADADDNLYYRLTPDSEGFSLSSGQNPTIVTTKSFDYDKIKHFQLELYVQDTPIGSSDSPWFNATTTINVTIQDIDNRPPCFHPFKMLELSGTTVCVGEQRYTGNVYLNEQQTGALALDPNPIRAIDGDSGINEEIVYSIVSGNEADVFAMDSSTGSITMLKAVTTPGTITLTVLAAQKVNVHQLATTSVSLAVLEKTDHKPTFPKPLYEGIVTAIGVMAQDKNEPGKLLRIVATDEDFNPGGINPNLIYSITGSDGFILTDGYLVMTTQLTEGTYSLEVHAVDSTDKQSATTEVSVEVKSGDSETPEVTPSSSADPNLTPGTTISGATPTVSQPSPETSTGSGTQTTAPTLPPDSSASTESAPIPSASTPVVPTTITGVAPESVTPSSDPSASTPVVPTTITGVAPESVTPSSDPSASTPVVPTTVTGVTPENITPSGDPSVTTAGTNTGVTVVTSGKPTATSSGSSQSPDGGESGATPSVSPTGTDAVSTGSTQPLPEGPSGGFDSTDMAALGATLGVLLFLALVIMGLLFFRLRREKKDWKKIHESNVFRSTLSPNSGGAKAGIQYSNKAFENDEDNNSVGPVSGVVLSTTSAPDARDYSKYESIVEPRLAPQGDDSSQSGSEKVKPILTKERRVEEGYKSVWFKEDIDPNAKEEVVIIPDSRENASDEDEDSSSDKEAGSESPRRRRRVLFNDTDGGGNGKKDGDVLSIDL